MNEEVVGSVDVEDFKYFICNDIIVVGVTEEDDDKVKFVVLRSEAYPQGMQGHLEKSVLQKEAAEGISLLVNSYEEAMDFDMAGHAVIVGMKRKEESDV